ncbi:MAG: DUF3368 domain-containing protein [Limisphaerales bacterium]
MMLVVADTSPVRYLVLVGAMDCLPKLYDAVVIPPAVRAELAHPAAPEKVRAWISTPPAWLSIKTPAKIQTDLNLGLGELEAIALAAELHAAALLLDDRHAREVAIAQGLCVAGTVGVLEKMAAAGLMDLRVILERLRQTNFRGDERLFIDALARFENK